MQARHPRHANLANQFAGQVRNRDGIFIQDLRITKVITLRERVKVQLMAEVFNVFNISNLTFVSSAGNCYSSGFGQPSARLGQLFGSGGPRAFQFAARVSF